MTLIPKGLFVVPAWAPHKNAGRQHSGSHKFHLFIGASTRFPSMFLAKEAMTRLLLVSILFTFFPVSVLPYSDGAGSCVGGQAAVFGSHLSNTKTKTTGTLQQGKLTLSVDGIVIPSGGTITVKYDSSTTLVVEGEKDYKGILYRLEAASGTDTTSLLYTSPGTVNTKISGECDPTITGVTHSNADLKNKVPAVLDIDKEELFYLDITVVVENTATSSEYYYTRYPVNVVKKTKSPTRQPKAPTQQPKMVMMGKHTARKTHSRMVRRKKRLPLT
jgi:hypothetical protein